jgi:hypothetical protein
MRRSIRTGIVGLGVVALAVVAGGCSSSTSSSAASSTSTRPATSTTLGSVYTVLAPATTRPAYKECVAPVSTDANGTVTPLQCADGAINVLAWKHYAPTAATILGLGSSATSSQVVSALCSAKSTLTTPILEDAFRLAYVYYGWTFSSNLAEDTLVNQPNACS